LRELIVMDWERPWLILENMRMRMTPSTMTAVPRMSVAVTASEDQPKLEKPLWELTGSDKPTGE